MRLTPEDKQYLHALVEREVANYADVAKRTGKEVWNDRVKALRRLQKRLTEEKELNAPLCI